MKLEIPITTPSVSNLREFWATRARRTKAQREAVYLCLRSAIARGAKLPDPPCRVTLTRQAPMKIRDQHDNLRAAMKPIVDELAKCLGVDDSDERVEWCYLQRKGLAAVVVEFEALAEIGAAARKANQDAHAGARATNGATAGSREAEGR